MKILVFGNPLVEKDSLALRLLPKLKKHFPEIQFKEFDPTENLGEEIENRKLKVLDVVEGTKKVIVIKEIEQLKQDKLCSMHDFDLGFNLKLLHKIGKLKEVEIIGVPNKMNEKEAFEEVVNILLDYN